MEDQVAFISENMIKGMVKDIKKENQLDDDNEVDSDEDDMKSIIKP
jgi:hypothetical protein